MSGVGGLQWFWTWSDHLLSGNMAIFKQIEFTQGNVPVQAVVAGSGALMESRLGAVPPTSEQLRAYCPSISTELSGLEWCCCCCRQKSGPQRADPEAASRAQPRPHSSPVVGFRSFREEKYSCFLKYVCFYKNSSNHRVTPRRIYACLIIKPHSCNSAEMIYYFCPPRHCKY